jgi:hypothetical protein
MSKNSNKQRVSQLLQWLPTLSSKKVEAKTESRMTYAKRKNFGRNISK